MASDRAGRPVRPLDSLTTSSSKVVSLEHAAGLVPDGATVTVSSSSGLGCPDLILRAIGQRFEETGHPRGLTTVHPIAAGDMYGIDGIDHLARRGLLRKIIAGSFPSGPSTADSPAVWRMIHGDEIEAYNVPSGVLFHIHDEIARGGPGVLTRVGLGTAFDPRFGGGRMNQRTSDDLVRVVEFDENEWLYLPSFPIDVAIVRGTSADPDGNISMEHEGAFLGGLEQAIAVRNQGGLVIAQVKRIVQRHSIPAQAVRIPGNLVDYVVIDGDQYQTTMTSHDPSISGEIRKEIVEFEPVPWGPEKVIARRAALELRKGEAVNLGFGISALVPHILIEEGHGGNVTWAIEQGAVGGEPLGGFQFGCAANPDAIVPSPAQFSYFQGGGFDRAFLSFLQIGQDGSVNVSKLAAKPHVTAGFGGFVDITAQARHLVFSGFMTAGGFRADVGEGKITIVSEGRARKLSPLLEHVSFNGARARDNGQEVVYVTERCVIRLTQDGLEVVEIAPGIDLDRDVLGQSDIPLIVSDDLVCMDERLFRQEPMGLSLQTKPRRTVPIRLEGGAAT